VAGNSGQPGRRVTGKTVAILPGPRYPSAWTELAARPSVEELRQVVPVSDMRGRLGAGPARCRMAAGYWLPTGAAGSSVSRCEPSNALLSPAARTSDERLGGQHARRIHLSASRVGPRPPGLALDSFRAAFHHFSTTPHKRPHRPDGRRTSLSSCLRHLPGSRLLADIYTCSGCGLPGNPAAEDEGVLP
jgi:hypothetical protein